MDGALERALDNSWLLKLFPSNENKNMFSSAFLFQNFFKIMVFLIIGTLFTQKHTKTNHVFYLVMPHEIKSCEK